MQRRDILGAGQRKFPHLQGASFLAAHEAGRGADYLYHAVQHDACQPVPFAQISGSLRQLADRIAERLTTTQTNDPSADEIGLAQYPHPHIVEITALLALIYDDPPASGYTHDAVGARFWNWWDWATGPSASANRVTALRRDERLTAAAAAIAVFHAQSPVMGRC